MNRRGILHQEDANQINVTEFPAANILGRLPGVRGAAALHPHLNDPAVLAGRFNHFSAVPNAQGQRLFYIDVFSRLAGHNRPQRVPAVRRGNHNRVDLRIVEHLSKILYEFGPVFMTFHHNLRRRTVGPAIGVADILDLNVRAFHQTRQQRASSTADAHNPQDDFILGR